MRQYLNAMHVVAISTSTCTLSSSCNREKQLKLYNLQKDVISTQKLPGYKKGVALFKNGQCEKSCEIKGAAKKWLWWYRLMAKILITAIQVASSQLH